MTFICVAIQIEESRIFEALEEAKSAKTRGAHMVEWRIDDIAHLPDLVDEIINKSPMPCIVTCRSSTEGGSFDGLESDRAAILEHALRTGEVRYIDIERATNPTHATSLRTSINAQNNRDQATRLVVSAHDFEGRPHDLFRQIQQMNEDESCSVVKLAWMARSLRDNLQAFEVLQHRQKPTIALCMGEFGLMSRVLAPKFGGFLTFASLDGASVTAPGQPSIDELAKLYNFSHIDQDTKVYGIIGWPTQHSLSPMLHNAGFDRVGHNGVYLPLPIAPEYEHFKATLTAFLDDRTLDFCGASVTAPHKMHLLRFAQEWKDNHQGRVEIESSALQFGAANTLTILDDGTLHICNTDIEGIRRAIESSIPTIAEDRDRPIRIGIIGAGGVARAAVAAFGDLKAELTVTNRTPSHSEALSQQFDAGNKANDQCSFVASVRACKLRSFVAVPFDLVINATTVGMAGGPAEDQSPLGDLGLRKFPWGSETHIFDAVYRPVDTPFLLAAQEAGCSVTDGSQMFVQQAIAQFKRWTGCTPDIASWSEFVRAAIA